MKWKVTDDDDGDNECVFVVSLMKWFFFGTFSFGFLVVVVKCDKNYIYKMLRLVRVKPNQFFFLNEFAFQSWNVITEKPSNISSIDTSHKCNWTVSESKHFPINPWHIDRGGYPYNQTKTRAEKHVIIPEMEKTNGESLNRFLWVLIKTHLHTTSITIRTIPNTNFSANPFTVVHICLLWRIPKKKSYAFMNKIMS